MHTGYRISLNGYVYFSFLVRKIFGLAFGITCMETAFHLTKRKVLGLADRDLEMVSNGCHSSSLRHKHFLLAFRLRLYFDYIMSKTLLETLKNAEYAAATPISCHLLKMETK